MDVARLNFSHGTYDVHEAVYRLVRQTSDETGHAVGVLVDLQGPKIRTGAFGNGPVSLEEGETFTITTDDVVGDEHRVGTTYDGLPGDVEVGDVLLIDDGKVALRATEVTGTDVVTTVEVAGEVSNHKGINLPGVAVSVPALSDKDEADLRFGLRLGADMVALSFVRSETDIERVHEIMDEEGIRRPVIAKIEKPQAVDNLVGIVEAFDGVMVARGDLGVELPLEEVPLVQKQAVELARNNAKPVIVATQVLESMIDNPRPTRAEASDCANAVLDGADAIMLSGESSIGAHPIEAVETMSRIIASTEEHGLERIRGMDHPPRTKGGAVTNAAKQIADVLSLEALIVFTQTGDTARRMARLRSSRRMYAFTPVPAVRNQLTVVWGIETYLVPEVHHTDQMAMQVDDALLTSDHLSEGDSVVLVAGSPPGIPGSTNALRVHDMGDAKNKVAPAYAAFDNG